MKSVTTAEFRRLYSSLPPDVREKAKQIYRLWFSNPHHSSLHFRRVHPSEPIFSVRIGLHYRAVALVDNQVANWFWIGSHSDYDKLLTRL